MNRFRFNLTEWLQEHLHSAGAVEVSGDVVLVAGVPLSEYPDAGRAIAALLTRAAGERDDCDVREDRRPADFAAFTRWLDRFKDENSPVGDLAGDVSRDEEWPPDGETVEELLGHLAARGAGAEACSAVRSAWASFMKESGRSDGGSRRGRPRRPRRA